MRRPGSERARERRFQGANRPGSESSRERIGPGAKRLWIVPLLVTHRLTVYAVGQLSPCRTVQASVPASRRCKTVGTSPGVLRHCRTVLASVPAYFSQPARLHWCQKGIAVNNGTRIKGVLVRIGSRGQDTKCVDISWTSGLGRRTKRWGANTSQTVKTLVP